MSATIEKTSIFDELRELYDRGLYLQAHRLGLSALGPFRQWRTDPFFTPMQDCLRFGNQEPFRMSPLSVSSKVGAIFGATWSNV